MAWLHFALFILQLIATALQPIDASIGVCYGGKENNLPSIKEVVSFCQEYNITRVRIYHPDPIFLQAVRGTNIELFVDITVDHIISFATSQAKADSYVRRHIQPYIGDVKFRYFSVGNEIDPWRWQFPYLVQAIENMQRSVIAIGLNDTKVSTTVRYELEKSYPPSTGVFSADRDVLMRPLVEVLRRNGAPLMVNVHPYYGYKLNQKQDPDYVFFGEGYEGIKDGKYTYLNMFDAHVDAMYAALERYEGGESVKVVVAETGWPTAGDPDGISSIENAKNFNRKLAKHVKLGTPRRPGEETETYLFELFNENLKTPVGTENYWGIFYPDKTPV
ncbi:Probable glucan endo-1,3-beta-glucosidase BG1, partial [Linum grandiflorum]